MFLKCNYFKVSLSLVLAITLGGCTSTIHRKSKIGPINSLSVDAKQRLAFVNEQGGVEKDQRIICAEPSPDSLVAKAAAISGNANYKSAITGQAAAGFKESAGELGMRTQSIQILRDGYYRLCEAYMNGAIDRVAYNNIIAHVDSFITVVTAIEAIAGSSIPKLSTLEPAKVIASTDDTGARAEADPSQITVQILERKPVSPEQAKVIERIVKAYLGYAAKRNDAL